MTFAQADAIGMVLSDRDFTPLIVKLKKLDKITLGFEEQKTKRPVKDAYLNFVLLHRQIDKIYDLADVVQVVKDKCDNDGHASNTKIANFYKGRGARQALLITVLLS